MNLKRAVLTAGLGVFATVGISQAGIVDTWDMDLVSVAPGPYTPYVTYYSTIFTDASLTTTNGAITWKETDVHAPGLKIVNGDDVNGTNCFMTTGFNPYDMTEKQCSDPLQSSKRFKVKNLLNGPIDVSFNVIDGPKSVYRAIQKLTDGTDLRWDGFTIQLGHTINGQFVPSTAGDGLGFSDTSGNYWTKAVTTYQSADDTFSAYFAQGLGGAPDTYHPEPGYFNPTERMGFGMIATEDEIVSDGITTTYSDVFGPWNNSSGTSIAIYYDDDNDINTDNLLMANCADAADISKAGTHTGDDLTGYSCNGVWVTYRSQVGLDANGAPYISDGIPKIIQLADLDAAIYTSKDNAIASGTLLPMYMDQIEDLANLGLTFWVAVDDNTSWPTPNNFTIRYTPVPVDGSTPPPAAEETICTDGLDNDNDGLADCSDPDCDGVSICGPEGKFDTCSDGYDNDGDGSVDCADAGCAKNKSCR